MAHVVLHVAVGAVGLAHRISMAVRVAGLALGQGRASSSPLLCLSSCISTAALRPGALPHRRCGQWELP